MEKRGRTVRLRPSSEAPGAFHGDGVHRTRLAHCWILLEGSVLAKGLLVLAWATPAPYFRLLGPSGCGAGSEGWGLRQGEFHKNTPWLRPPWRQPRGKWMVSLANSHTNATMIGWHLWEIDLRFAPGLPPGWLSLCNNTSLAYQE